MEGTSTLFGWPLRHPNASRSVVVLGMNGESDATPGPPLRSRNFSSPCHRTTSSRSGVQTGGDPEQTASSAWRRLPSIWTTSARTRVCPRARADRVVLVGRSRIAATDGLVSDQPSTRKSEPPHPTNCTSTSATSPTRIRACGGEAFKSTSGSVTPGQLFPHRPRLTTYRGHVASGRGFNEPRGCMTLSVYSIRQPPHEPSWPIRMT